MPQCDAPQSDLIPRCCCPLHVLQDPKLRLSHLLLAAGWLEATKHVGCMLIQTAAPVGADAGLPLSTTIIAQWPSTASAYPRK